MAGPLKGITLVEFAGIGPGPFCGMVLADLGAEIIRIDRSSQHGHGNTIDFQHRSKSSLSADLKNSKTVDEIKKLLKNVDGLIEGFRPGVMERLGLGPDICLSINPKLVYGRMTGWGQDGPLAKTAGHDINYIALTGALEAMGRKNETPPPPLNLVGDFGGGGMFLALGIVSALLSIKNGGKGQVVDAAMVDGASVLMSMFYAFKASGFWQDERESNMLDGAAHFYDSYECADKKFLAIGSIEPQFYSILLEKLKITDPKFQDQMSRDQWPELKLLMQKRIKQKTRDEWADIFDGSDACVAPILSLSEAPEHHHIKARKTFVEVDGVIQPAPAPRFSETSPEIHHSSVKAGQNNDEICEKFKLDRSCFS
jgi:alpha-methylacyl-CoA racemase